MPEPGILPPVVIESEEADYSAFSIRRSDGYRFRVKIFGGVPAILAGCHYWESFDDARRHYNNHTLRIGHTLKSSYALDNESLAILNKLEVYHDLFRRKALSHV